MNYSSKTENVATSTKTNGGKTQKSIKERLIWSAMCGSFLALATLAVSSVASSSTHIAGAILFPL
jgi:formate/nitrite transporter FocA (FNT family)